MKFHNRYVRRSSLIPNSVECVLPVHTTDWISFSVVSIVRKRIKRSVVINFSFTRNLAPPKLASCTAPAKQIDRDIDAGRPWKILWGRTRLERKREGSTNLEKDRPTGTWKLLLHSRFSSRTNDTRSNPEDDEESFRIFRLLYLSTNYLLTPRGKRNVRRNICSRRAILFNSDIGYRGFRSRVLSLKIHRLIE